jgi:hypothetical protein
MKKSDLKKLIKEVLIESQNDDIFKPGTYTLDISPSGDGRDWQLYGYVQLSKPMTKLDALRAIFKKMNTKFNDNDAFAYELNKINPKALKVYKV